MLLGLAHDMTPETPKIQTIYYYYQQPHEQNSLFAVNCTHFRRYFMFAPAVLVGWLAGWLAFTFVGPGCSLSLKNMVLRLYSWRVMTNQAG